MIRHVWTVYCREVLIDKRTNNVSMIQAIESIGLSVGGDEIDSGEDINVPFNSWLITLWARKAWDTPVTSKMRIRFIGPDGSELINSTTIVNLQEHRRNRANAEMNGLRVKESGVYEWVVERLEDDREDSWVEEARIPVGIEIERSGEGDDVARA